MTDPGTRARELLKKATRGPWTCEQLTDNVAQVPEVLTIETSDGDMINHADAALIAAAPELLTALLAELDAAEARIARLEEALRPLAACCLLRTLGAW